MKKWAVNTIDINSIDYPCILAKIPNPPKKLYYKGVWNKSLFENCLAMVGSRKISLYGTRVVEEFIKGLNLHSITIVSGFMTGVDWQSHSNCVLRGGKTVAVLPWGINFPLNSLQESLLEKILENGGLLISEFPGSFGPQPWTYPRRNRIVAGLSKATLVVEAGLKSGSLITADFSYKFGRCVFVIPGSIFSEYSLGCLQLLNSYGVGVLSPQEINRFFGVYADNVSFEGVPSFTNSDIATLLSSHPLSLEDLAHKLSLSLSLVSKMITPLILSGEVLEKGGLFYVGKS